MFSFDTGYCSVASITGASHNKKNREQRIRISTYQKLCIPQYMISDRLKFLFSVLCSFYCEALRPFYINLQPYKRVHKENIQSYVFYVFMIEMWLDKFLYAYDYVAMQVCVEWPLHSLCNQFCILKRGENYTSEQIYVWTNEIISILINSFTFVIFDPQGSYSWAYE